ncbi:hypothetical protein J2W62_000153 [Bacillus safensis]|nr:hypothetical protein [Bacillus sp. TBS-096]MDR6680870.1 hypothetical protein [Bacillus safensis]
MDKQKTCGKETSYCLSAASKIIMIDVSSVLHIELTSH